MDTIDVGGASAGGRPVMPPITTVDELGSPIEDHSYDVPEVAVKPATEPSVKVQRAVQSTPIGRAFAAYPDTHPANMEGVEQDPDGGIILPKGAGGGVRKPLGDIRDGYVSGPRDDPRNSGQPVMPTKREDVDGALETLKAEMALAEAQAEGQTTAHNEEGTPLIEVLFHLDVGVIASYHNHIIEQNQWLVFVDDNRQPAKQKFIPKPGKEAEPLAVTIIGADKVPQERTIRPLGINFTLGHFDLFVTMVIPEAEE